MPRRWKVFLLIAFLALVLDQATKIWARHSLPLDPAHAGIDCTTEVVDKIASHQCFGRSVDVIADVWAWRLSMNPGSAFGLFNSATGARIFLSIVGILAVIGMGFLVRRAKDTQFWLAVALGLVAGGAVGNLVDRIYFGVVTDFTLWHWKDKFEWPVFNVADAWLVIGVVLLVFDVGKEDKKSKKKKQNKAKLPKATVEKTGDESPAA
jgi:signal peptidase II